MRPLACFCCLFRHRVTTTHLAQADSELSLLQGELVLVHRPRPDGRVLVTQEISGQTGLFHSSVLQALERLSWLCRTTLVVYIFISHIIKLPKDFTDLNIHVGVQLPNASLRDTSVCLSPSHIHLCPSKCAHVCDTCYSTVLHKKTCNDFSLFSTYVTHISECLCQNPHTKYI